MAIDDGTSENHVKFDVLKNDNLDFAVETLMYFGWIDIMTFGIILLVCCLTGLYFGFSKSPQNSSDYLLGGRSMKTFPVAISLIASYISGIFLLGIPAEVYVHGMQIMYFLCGFPLLALIFQIIFLPVFSSLNITSVYEYLEKRFDRKVRFFGLLIFTINSMFWLPIVIYVPALTFNQVTGVNIYITSSVIAVVSIFYTTIGGIKAVIWSDVIQTGVMFASTLIVIIKGTIDVGSISMVIERNLKGGRIEPPNLDLNPMVRHTLWGLMIGGCMSTLASNTINQSMIQKYLSLPTLGSARRANWIFLGGFGLLLFMCGYTGFLIFAVYHNCDPLTTKIAEKKDQLVPLLVMNLLGKFPGLPGLFVGAVFSASLSSLSTGLNSMSAVILEDFYKLLFAKSYTDKRAKIIMKSTVVVIGVICAALVPVLSNFGLVFQLSLSIGSISVGALLGIFTMGVLMPWISVQGALAGGASGLLFTSWICFKAQMAIASGNLQFTEKPVSVDGCNYNFTMSSLNQNETISNNLDDNDEIFPLYRISYLWFTPVGAITCILVGTLVSFCKRQDPYNVKPELLTPFIRKKYFPNVVNVKKTKNNKNVFPNMILVANRRKSDPKPLSNVESTNLLISSNK